MGAMKLGRQSKYSPEYVAKIIELTYEGKTMRQISNIVDVSIRTLYDWMQMDTALSQAIKEARKVSDDEVEVSLLQRAMGYSHPETKVFLFEGVVIEHEVMKHYPPDPASMIFWLKNRRPNEWREKAIDVPVDESIEELKKMTIPQLLALVKNKDEING